MPARVRVAVVGAGALGQLVGALLAHDGRTAVTVVSRRPEAVEAIRARGVEVRRLATGEPSLRARPAIVAATAAPASAYDVVLLLHKSYDTGWAVGLGCSLAAPDGAIVALQNGLASADAVEKADPRGVAGVIYQGAAYVGPGVVDHTVLGPLVAAPPPDRAGRVAALLEPLASPALPVRLHPDRDAMLWEKAVNAVSNAVAGALFLPVRAITRSPSAWEVMERARAEVLAVAEALGVRPDRAFLSARFAGRPVARDNLGSTYQSLRGGRPTEIGEYAGEIEALGARLGVPTPVLGALRLLVAAREEAGREGTAAGR
ncbi:2-dehydropantoate 2-reductase [Phytohabitans sp. ZYX-F-186]|uniref:2-dehydropantoate 2-reductase n=1 Tax=Phytohabitans maris TaxID=3071409 RepID=A0ABU0Z9S8_9ACTN|nr:2-dehydropantoate 2-reductase [Phytohabitans sp. ZYX-F-186]MDQ7903790.1 2-dehydropantoate 2-reductase [Phytohabitans sp. ZYX-F-186]